MVELKSSTGKVLLMLARWDLYKLWHCGLSCLLCSCTVCEFMRGKSIPSFGLLNTFSDTQKGFRKEANLTTCARVPPHGPEHRYLRTHYGNFLVWPFRTLKLRELLLDYPRIFSLASDVGIPILGQGQATWECSGHISSQRQRHGDKYTELKPVSIAHLKWMGFHFYKSQNNAEKQILICLMSLKELLEKLHHRAESTLGCSV